MHRLNQRPNAMVLKAKVPLPCVQMDLAVAPPGRLVDILELVANLSRDVGLWTAAYDGVIHPDRGARRLFRSLPLAMWAGRCLMTRGSGGRSVHGIRPRQIMDRSTSPIQAEDTGLDAGVRLRERLAFTTVVQGRHHLLFGDGGDRHRHAPDHCGNRSAQTRTAPSMAYSGRCTLRWSDRASTIYGGR